MLVAADHPYRSADPTVPEAAEGTATEPRLSTLLLQLALGLLEERGADAQALLARCGAREFPPGDPALRVPTSTLTAVLDVAAAQLGDDNIGLHAGQRADAGRLGILGLLSHSAPSLRALSPVLRRFSRLLHDECVIGLDERDGSALVTYRSSEDGHRQSAELVIAAFVTLARRTWPGFALREVLFMHAAPSGSDELAAFFGVPLRFGARHNGFVCAIEQLDRPAPSADPGLHALLVEHAERLLGASDFVGSVRHAVARGLLLGHSGAPWVAAELGVSLRTLHRRLQAQRAGFSEILDAERDRRAQQYLLQGQSIAVIAKRLGFASAGAFRKAFRRWTATTPSEFRQRGRTVEADPVLS
ncbi:MAG TPA: AraC family transcriptional regulator [Polyangiales bacterium]|nr:AraC family transcriptional regulator [Polyangiales bacterium]